MSACESNRSTDLLRHATRRLCHHGDMSDTSAPFTIDGLDAAAPQPPTDEELQRIIDEQGVKGVVTGVRIVVQNDGQPAVMFVVLTANGEVSAIPSNASGYLGPLADHWVGRKATVVLPEDTPTVASYLSIGEEKLTDF